MEIVDELKNEVRTEVHLDEPTQVFSYIMNLKYDVKSITKEYYHFVSDVYYLLHCNVTMIKYYEENVRKFDEECQKKYKEYTECNDGTKDLKYADYQTSKRLRTSFEGMLSAAMDVMKNAELFNITSNPVFKQVVKDVDTKKGSNNDNNI